MCRLQNLREATGMTVEQTECISTELADRISASSGGEVRFVVEADATIYDLALLWQIATSIDLFCRIEENECVLQTTPFVDEESGIAVDECDDELLQMFCSEDGQSAPQKKKQKKKKRAYLKSMPFTVSELSLDRSIQRREAKLAAKLLCEREPPRMFASTVDPKGLDRYVDPKGLDRNVDNRPAWMALAAGRRARAFTGPPPTSAPAKPLQANNKGFEMLRRLGWAVGSGLGTHEQGIVDPVEVNARAHRLGLGLA
jgi:hypothetical protein